MNQLTNPPTTVWKGPEGIAQGYLTYSFLRQNRITIIKARFDKGYCIEGTYVQYHPNGIVGVTGEYANGLRSGSWQYYDMSGKLKNTCTFQDGICISLN